MDGTECIDKLDSECDEMHTDLTRNNIKVSGYNERKTLTRLSHLGPPLRNIDETFQQLNGATFYPWTGPCVDGPCMPQNLMAIAMKCSQASPDIMLSPRLQRAQSSTKFIAPWAPTPLH